MEHTVLLCVLPAIICLSITAEPVASSPDENRSQYPGDAVLFKGNKPVREGELLQLADYVKHGDSLLKERLQTSYSALKEQLQEGDSRLKERVSEGEDQIKEQLKDGDSRLKEKLDEDVAWLKDRLDKEQNRMKADFQEEEKRISDAMLEKKEAFEKLQDSVTTWTESSSALMDSLKQQMSDLQAEVSSTKQMLQTTQTEQATNQQTLQSTQERMKTADKEVQTTREKLQAAEEEIRSLKVKVDSLHSSHPSSLPGSLQTGNGFQSETGSTFIRWGHTTCPSNTSLVYSGIAGGSWFDHTGGASNYLCLVMDPQLDNKTAIPGAVNYLYGSEYEQIHGHHEQDVVCSVCRAPQATTLLIPATLTCPAGWTTQYKGHLMSAHNGHKGRTEYVCVDEDRENNQAGHGNSNGALFYYVVTQCGSLPCPPYVNNLITTCVVCSQ